MQLTHLDDGRHVRVVHATCRDIGREHDEVGALAELVGNARAVRLRLAGVHLEHGRAERDEELRVHLSHARGGEEDEHL